MGLSGAGWVEGLYIEFGSFYGFIVFTIEVERRQELVDFFAVLCVLSGKKVKEG